jgi:hypothetical protein
LQGNEKNCVNISNEAYLEATQATEKCYLWVRILLPECMAKIYNTSSYLALQLFMSLGLPDNNHPTIPVL